MSSFKEETVLESYVSYGRGGAGNCRKLSLSFLSVHHVAPDTFSQRHRFSNWWISF